MCMNMNIFPLLFRFIISWGKNTNPSSSNRFLIDFFEKMKKEKLIKKLQKVNGLLEKHNQYREWILQALAEGKTTADGETQHEKLETLDRLIRKDTSFKQDIEAILASEYGYRA